MPLHTSTHVDCISEQSSCLKRQCNSPAGGQWPGAPPGGWTVPSAEPPQQLLQQKSSGGGPVPSPDYFGNALHRDSGGSPHARPRGSEQEVSPSSQTLILIPRMHLHRRSYEPACAHCSHVTIREAAVSVMRALQLATSLCSWLTGQTSCWQVPDSAAIPPDTDFSLMYRFLGGLFDADSSLDHAHVLDKVRGAAHAHLATL